MENTLVCGWDLETTGTSPTQDLPVQVGMAMRLYANGSYTDHEGINMLCNPGKPIDPGAAAVHGITDAQVANAPSSYEVLNYLATMIAYYAQGREAYVCTYNGAAFDAPMAEAVLGRPAFTIPHIDVLRLIRHQFPEVRGSLGGKKLGEMHEVFVGRPLQNAHDAVADIRGTLDLLDALLRLTGRSLADISEEQKNPKVYEVLPLGKYIGRPIEEVPRSWAQFLASKGDLDPDLRATVNAILAR